MPRSRHTSAVSPLILMASANPSSWNRVKEALGDQFAISYSVDLGGTLDVVRRHRPAVVILGRSLLDADLGRALRELRRQAPATSLIVITAAGQKALSASDPEHCADAYLDEQRVSSCLEEVVWSLLETPGAAEPRPTADGRGSTSADADRSARRAMVVGTNPRVVKLMERARRVAEADATVLISGESGTGKEVLARWIHGGSPRARGAFETVDLPSIPADLFESILFGHERGSFTGAVSPTRGKFQRAHGGTLFLDEISSLRPELQPKLLRAIQEKEVERVGGRRPERCDVRIIAATNTDLQAAVKQGLFRSDLFFRLNVLSLTMVPLRERREDIPALVGFFIQAFADQYRRVTPRATPAALEALSRHRWPGNIRELENRVHRAMLLSPSEKEQLEACDFFDDEARSGAGSPPLDLEQCSHSLATIERLYINRVLEETDGNLTRAAQILQITRKTLRNKLHSYSREDLPASDQQLQSVS